MSAPQVVPVVPVVVAAQPAHIAAHGGRHRQLQETHPVPQEARTCSAVFSDLATVGRPESVSSLFGLAKIDPLQ